MVAVIACVKKVSDRVLMLCVILPLCYARSKLDVGILSGNFIRAGFIYCLGSKSCLDGFIQQVSWWLNRI